MRSPEKSVVLTDRLRSGVAAGSGTVGRGRRCIRGWRRRRNVTRRRRRRVSRARTTVSSIPSGAWHRIEFLLLLRSEKSADLDLRAVHELAHLRASFIPRQRVVPHESLPLRRCILVDLQRLVGLRLRQVEHLLQMLHLLRRIALPATRVAFRPLFAAGGRRWRRLRRFVGRAEGGPGGNGETGCDDCDPKRWFHTISSGDQTG